MNVVKFLSHLRSLNVNLWLDGGRLRVKAPKGVFTPELKEEMTLFKDEILRFLQGAQFDESTVREPETPSLNMSTPSLSREQLHTWTGHYFSPNPESCNLVFAWMIEGNLSLDTFGRAFKEVASRHNILRTLMPLEEGVPVARHGEGKVTLKAVNLKVIEESLRFAEAVKRAQEEAKIPLCPEKGPLLRAIWYRIQPGKDLLVFIAHPIICDRCSLNLIIEEIASIYSDLIQNRTPAQPKEQNAYEVYTTGQLKWLQSEEASIKREFWQTFYNNNVPLEIPLDFPRPATFSTDSNRISCDLIPSIWTSLNKFAQDTDVHPSHIFLSALIILSGRYSDLKKFSLGVSLSRRKSIFNNTVGPFDEEYPLQVMVNDSDSFRSFALSTRNACDSLSEMAQFPHIDAMNPANIDSNLFRSSRAHVAFEYVESEDNLCIDNAVCHHQNIDSGHSHSDIKLSIAVVKNQAELILDYNTSLFRPGKMAGIVNHLVKMLEVFIKLPDLPVKDVDFLSEDERHNLLVNWNNTETEISGSALLHSSLLSIVRNNPSWNALILEDKTLSYQELDHLSDQIGRALLNLGTGPGSLVGVCLYHQDIIPVILGILKSGAAFLPLDPSYPSERLSFILEDSKANLLVTSRGLIDILPEFPEKTIFIEDHPPMAGTDLPISEITPNEPAFVIYTSGSTGSPKGVVVSHGAIVTRVQWMCDNFPVDQDSPVLFKMASSFDPFILEAFWPLSMGGQLVTIKPNGHKDPEYLLNLIDKHHISVAQFVPSGLDDFLEKVTPGCCGTLKNVLCGGDIMSPKLRERFYRKLPHVSLTNCYGPTEGTVLAASWNCDTNLDIPFVPIGKPVSNTSIFILDSQMRPVPVGVPGEIYIGGKGVTNGYLHAPDLTASSYIANPFHAHKNDRLYKTGDMARFSDDGVIEFLGRKDDQVKIGGFRIELEEIRRALTNFAEIQEALICIHKVSSGKKYMVAYFTTVGNETPDEDHLRQSLRLRFPEYMVPTSFVPLSALPLFPDGKVNRAALPVPDSLETATNTVYPRANNEIEREIARAWRSALNVEHIGLNDNFFDIGGTPLLLIQVYQNLPKLLRSDIKPLDLLKYPTIHSLNLFLEKEEEEDSFFTVEDNYRDEIRKEAEEARQLPGFNIAVVGMSCRFPGANSPDEFWANIKTGKESITFFSQEELLASGLDPEQVNDPDYVRAKGIIEGIKDFDASFFGFTPREAQITDPQHRILLECAWEAMENAGYDPEKYHGKVGLFAGAGNNYYLMKNINGNPRIRETVGDLPIFIGNDKDNLCARISFKLGLTGPSVALQTACSTSLVAIHLASRSLQFNECNLAMAGGIALRSLEREGYLYEEGLLLPPDGHTRCFDQNAKGSVPGQGAGLVVLKRLEDAITDGDNILAVIKGSAVNNDGWDKVGYTAYSVTGQEEVIESALQSAELSASDISYVETSSSASPMGDPIEAESLTRVFRKHSNEKHICAIGAVKPNIGALDIAAGSAAFMKTVLALRHKKMPPTIHYTTPNPKIDFASGPLYVNTELKDWQLENQPLRAGVSGFGMGGTNAHIIIEEPPARRSSSKARPWQLINFSAQTPTALEKMTERLISFMRNSPDVNFSDLAYTLQVGRKDHKYRRMLVCQNLHEAIIELENKDPRRVYTAVGENKQRPIAFMFPGQGSQYTNMGQQLYQVDLTFRAEVDKCWDVVRNLFPELYDGLSEKDRRSRTAKLHQTDLTQVSLFIVEYALANTLIGWGIKPAAMIGNSTGEYVAACLSGVFSLEDAIRVVIGRGRLMRNLPPGDMVAVGLSEQELLPYLDEKLSLAGVASPSLCMVSGSKSAISQLRSQLTRDGILTRPLFAPHAFHSYMVDPIVPKFAEMISGVSLSPPKIPFISTTTGTWITDEEATDAFYWARQQRQTVRFAQGVNVLFQEKERILLEVGPDKSLSSPATQSHAKTMNHLVLSTMRQPQEDISDVNHLLTTIGRLWLSGVQVDWKAIYSDKRRYRVPLPTYPFERDQFWIDAPRQTGITDEPRLDSDKMKAAPTPDNDYQRPNVSTGFVAPMDQVQEVIADLWKDFLGLEQIGIHDDFFELGGSSLIAVRLINQLSKKFGVPLASHILLQKRTISTLADLIRENQSNPNANNNNSPLVEIQKGSPRNAPIFMVHPIGGEIYFYRDISHYMGPGQPVYGFQAPSLTGENEPFSDIEKQASAYIKALKEFKPQGPYLLGGASYGGMVALEMAQQLIANGEKVPLLIIVDSPAPGQMPSKFTDTAAILEYLLGDKLELDLDILRSMSPEDQMSYISEQARSANRVDVLPPSLGVPLFKTWMGHQTALHSYRPKDYPGQVIFFWPTERMKVNPPKMYLPWIDFVKGGIEIHQIGGNHITMNFGENAKAMARHLQRTLRGFGQI